MQGKVPCLAGGMEQHKGKYKDDDILYCFSLHGKTPFFRKGFMQKIYAGEAAVVKFLIFFLILCGLFLCFFIWEMKQLVVQNYTVSFRNLPEAFDGCRIVQLSDLHGNRFGKNQERLLMEIEKQNPDYIMVTGDMVTDCYDKSVSGLLLFLTELCSRYRVYYEPGNHETRALSRGEEEIRQYMEFCEAVKNTGVHYLENRKVCLERGSQKISVCGLSLERMYFGKLWWCKVPQKQHIEELLGIPEKEEFLILLAHHPDYFPVYESWGADLVLSGHIHGGIAKLPYIGGVLSPTMKFFPGYDGGIYQGEGKDAKMVLSRGLGSHTIPLRPFNPPELVVVTMCCNSDKNHVYS